MKKRLSELKPGERGVISKVVGDREVRRRLLDMGLTRGTEIIVVRRAPLGDPVEFLLKGYNLSLRKKESENVYVLVEEGKEG
ncbi:ferrous iron transport protein A [Candidatus Bathyarchaeota archaeon]|nr:ferrous iron transport protein A [Candidatus Bathyarchaeota archaeon]